ncbi:ankyrin repeat domain-containing protein [Rothia sp. AR01]|uniref:Ankyrin repeat domain-containing protein n=1 Tax=Rothia santali TaxID=2949643 RepID=A0A9X2KHK5_9MICC|nr:ankyrin repeat domain-containing protein [Rothia santali]MCP3425273.1 ankyrin repeat domain-containing protein [Rothia santali]
MTQDPGGTPAHDEAPELDDREIEALNAVFDLAREGHTADLEALLDQGLPVNLTNSKGDTLLILAAYRQQPDVVRALLRRGADTDRLNDRGQTALASAVFRDNAPIARLLIEAGADPSLGAQTPAAIAAFFGLEEMAALLAEHGIR